MAIPPAAMDPTARLSEQCLHANVWTPSLSGRRPVLVWIHGGSLAEGAGSQAWYDGSTLARRGDIVVVTFNYRLGALGWLHLGELGGEQIGAVRNAGMLDQIRALEWVATNVEAFGGDSANVTVAGQSAGSRSVVALLTSPRAEGLFAKSIALSGGAYSLSAVEATAQAERFLARVGCSAADLEPLARMPVEELAAASAGLFTGPLPEGVPGRFAHVVDDRSLPQDPLVAISAGAGASVATIFGSTLDECRLMNAIDADIQKADEATCVERLAGRVGQAAARRLYNAYRAERLDRGVSSNPPDVFTAVESELLYSIPMLRLAEAHARRDAPTYMSLFVWASPDTSLGACHTIDLSFIFGTFDIAGMDAFTGGGAAAVAVSEALQDAWFEFMQSGDPSTPALAWPQFEDLRRATMLLGDPCEIADAPLAGARAVWDGIV